LIYLADPASDANRDAAFEAESDPVRLALRRLQAHAAKRDPGFHQFDDARGSANTDEVVRAKNLVCRALNSLTT